MRISRLASVAALIALSGCSTFESLDSLLGEDNQAAKVRLQGERLSVLSHAEELQPDAALQAEPMDLRPLPANGAWPQVYATAAGVAGNLAYDATGEQDDAVTFGKGNDYGDTLVSPPVIAAGMVFGMDGAGIVSAHAQDGLGEQWRSKAVYNEDSKLAGGGVAYARGRLVAVNSAGKIAALDSTSGKVAWEDALNFPVRTPPRIYGTTVLIQTLDQQLFAINLADGRLLWRHRGVGEAASLMAQTSPAVADNVVVAAYGSGDILGLSIDTGEELWASSLTLPGAAAATAAFGGFVGAPIIHEHVAYAGSANGVFAAVDIRDGQRLWEQNITVRGTPYIVGDYVFVLDMSDVLYAMHTKTGNVRWSLALPRFANEDRQNNAFLWQGPVVAGGRAWLVSARGRLIGVSAEKGEIVIDRDVADDIRHAPVIALNRMWLVDSSARLHVLK
jgi:outer membrane protein assembly factor BamB